jgi:hypothetical protein
LHNPEYYLVKNVPEAPGEMDTETLTEYRAEMERRLFEAFKALEEEIVTEKRITSYGISSNSFSLPPTHPHFLRYDNLIELAQRAAEEVHAAHTQTDTDTETDKKEIKHHFTTMQLPANLVEQEGLTHAVEWAHTHNIHTLINRPLNAFSNTISLRLAEYKDTTQTYTQTRDALLDFCTTKSDEEEALEKKEGYVLFREEVEEVDERLQKGERDMDNVLAWENIASRVIVPALRKGLEATSEVG